MALSAMEGDMELADRSLLALLTFSSSTRLDITPAERHCLVTRTLDLAGALLLRWFTALSAMKGDMELAD